MARRVKKFNVAFISLCPRGANRLPVLAKEDGTFDLQTLVKADMTKGEILAVVYAPNLVDSQGDWADADAIRDAAHTGMKNGLAVDIRHDGKALTKEQVHPAESFIIQPGDPRFVDFKDYDGTPVDVTGGWAVVLKVDDPAIKAKYGDEGWNGVSMGGTYLRAEKSDESDWYRYPPLFRKLLKALGIAADNPATPPIGDPEMTPAELAANNAVLVKSFTDALVPAIGTAMAAAVTGALGAQQDAALAKAAGVKSTDSKEIAAAKILLHKDAGATATEGPAASADDKPVFKGDLFKAEDVSAFELQVAEWEATKGLNKHDPVAVRAASKKVAELRKAAADRATATAGDGDLTPEEIAADCKKEEPAEVRLLKVQLAQAQGRSAVPATGDAPAPLSFNGLKLSKEDQESLQAGDRIANAASQMYGPSAPGAAPKLVPVGDGKTFKLA